MHKEEKCGFNENMIWELFLEIRKVLAAHGQFLVSSIISKVLCVSTYYVVVFDCEWILIHAKSSYQSSTSFCGGSRGNVRIHILNHTKPWIRIDVCVERSLSCFRYSFTSAKRYMSLIFYIENILVLQKKTVTITMSYNNSLKCVREFFGSTF